jgi:voltage-gated potassium channel Kch
MAQFRIGAIGKAYVTMIRAIAIAFTNKNVLVLLSLTGLIASGAAVVFMLLEDWRFIDALYFAVVSMATVGYGDFVPKTGAGKIFTIGYMLIGIGMFVTTVAAIAEAMLSALRHLSKDQ